MKRRSVVLAPKVGSTRTRSSAKRVVGSRVSGALRTADLFSGCGGMSYGFARRPEFRLVGAIDAEHAKPCEGFGRLDCNATYRANLGLEPRARDLSRVESDELAALLSDSDRPLRPGELDCLLCCPPCTDFSRAKPSNHRVDSQKNSLVVRCAAFVEALRPEFVVMENARELIQGNHRHHYDEFERRLRSAGYDVHGAVYRFDRFGLPQIRERAIVVARRNGPVKTLADLWDGWRVAPDATTVRRAIGRLASPPVVAGAPPGRDPLHVCPGFGSDVVRRRIAATPADGGSWIDLRRHPHADELLTDAMKRRIAAGELGSHPDVYGRLAWDRPCVTIKRECAHVGNGRYAHPEQTRLLTVREMSILQGFPADYVLEAGSLANKYRHLGDAVPPLVSYQLSALVTWMKTGRRPGPDEFVLSGTSLRPQDVVPDGAGG